MPPKTITPSFGASSFACPHCGALANQTWFVVRAERESQERRAWVADDEVYERVKKNAAGLEKEHQQLHQRFLEYVDRARTGAIFLWKMDKSTYDDYELTNVNVSRCFSCGEVTVWRHKAILFPISRYEVEPNADLPEHIRQDFEEARSILDLSPRGAAALLRLCIQKLCIHLGKPGKSIDADIASLVKDDGLDARIQRALDIVRVIGNESVHPGTIDMKDDRATAAKLFELVNRIAYDRITHPKEIDALYANLPKEKLEAIAKRDGSKTSTS
jgi:predicted RNA-binding Zn-ribbon protein involved in translation (DUF1610 family)